MAEDRPLEDTTDAITKIREEHDDFKATILARLNQRPTGDIEASIRSTAKVGTLLCNGAVVSRTTYAALWKFAQDQGLVTGGLFTVGDGSTTFGLPDLRGRSLTGADATRPLGSVFGTQTKTIAEANLPAHDHSGRTAADSPSHQHYSGGNHGGHRPSEAPGLGGNDGARWPTIAQSGSGDVGWSGNANQPHYHNFTTDRTGSGTALNVETPAIAINYFIWT